MIQHAVSLPPADTGGKKEGTVMAALPPLLSLSQSLQRRVQPKETLCHYAAQMIRIVKDRVGGERGNNVHHHNMGKLVSFKRYLQV